MALNIPLARTKTPSGIIQVNAMSDQNVQRAIFILDIFECSLCMSVSVLCMSLIADWRDSAQFAIVQFQW